MIPIQKNWRLTLASAAAVALLASCGGGEDASSSAASANAPLAAQQSTAVPMAAARTHTVDATAAPAADGLVARTEAAAPAASGNGVYLVEMADLPAAAYDGRIGGYASTKVAQGQKLNPDSPNVSRYMSRLAAKHDAAMNNVGASKKIYSYGYAFNGFAAVLTDEQAAKLASSKEVLAVTKDEVRAMDTSTTPAFLGLSGNTGFWASTGAKGENVIIGMVDSGIWPQSLSFSDMVDANGAPATTGTQAYSRPPSYWHGKCVKGEKFTAGDCNRKLIGARFYHAGWTTGGFALSPSEFESARDAEGHGTHTASTAGGNSGVVLNGPTAALGVASGMAPRARIAAYKVCWTPTAQVTGGCFTSDSVAAIDQAVADGVDVINFSISGSQTSSRDPVEIAYMFAADAGVFVSASAGNQSATESVYTRVAHTSPWLTTVAASTHNRTAKGTATLGNGTPYTGISMAATAVPSSVFIDSVNAALAGADPVKAAQCWAAVDNANVAVLDPAKVAGKIVLCDRGVTARVNKSLAVQQAGGAGMVLVNTSAAADGLVADFHSVPTVHLPVANRAAIKAYAATATPTAAISKSFLDFTVPAPQMASFSYAGPTQAANSGNMLKPDVTAPGVDVVAAVSPPGNLGRKFDLYSGTSMSSPHVAGIGALMKQLHPNWSPMAIKSALMTTAGDAIANPGNAKPASYDNAAALNFRQGAGHVRPANAANPGLVFDSNLRDWYGYLCGTDLPTTFCSVPANNALNQVVPVISPQNMNVASIALAQMPGSQTVTRRVTNVGGSASTYTGTQNGLAGLSITMSPSSLSINAGETKTVAFTVTNLNTTAVINNYYGGNITLADGSGHSVRIPVVVRPVRFSAPGEVNGSYGVSMGYQGTFAATADGLVPATASTNSVTQSAHVDINLGMLPAGATYARFQMFDGGTIPAGTDIDIDAYCGAPVGQAPMGSSGGSTAAELITIRNPVCASPIYVRVTGYAVTGSVNFTLYSWFLAGTAGPGNMGLSAPTTATVGATPTITIAPAGLTAATKYMYRQT